MKSSLFSKAYFTAAISGLRAAGLIVLLILQSAAFAQTTFYIDPGFTGTPQTGTITNPYSAWSQVSFANGNTYLQKRETTYTTPGNIWIFQKSGITLGAYGTGAKPKIISSGTGNKVVDFGNSPNCSISNLEIYSTGNSTTGIYFAGGCANNLIDSCEVHDCEWGIRITTTGGGNRVLHTLIHHTGDDGIYVKDVPNIEIGYCTIHSVNMKWFVNTDESYSSGDCVQMSSTNNLNYNIHHNTFDHSLTGNKFCFISYGVNYTGVIEHNTMIGNASGNNSCIYFHATTGTVTVRYNTLRNGSHGIYSYVDNLQLQYNKIKNNTFGIRVLTNHNLTALNNVFYGNESYGIASLGSTIVTSRNNVFYLTSASSKAYSTGGTLISDYNDFYPEQAGFINGYNTMAAWRAATGNDTHGFVTNPQFVNPASDDFCLQSNSPCINNGTNVNIPADFFGTAVPQAGSTDVGIHEVVSSSNQAPVINNQSFGINENSPAGTSVGQVIATDPNQGQTLTYAITTGNTSGAFSLGSSSGLLTVANASALDFETNPVFQLTVQVTDNGPGTLSSSAQITVNLINVNEPPVIAAQTFAINENSPAGTQVGPLVASDPDEGQTLSYQFTSGNTGNAFQISASGLISVASPQMLNFENQESFQLTSVVTDNGSPVLSASAAITINILNVNENPVITPGQTFTIAEHVAIGTQIGTVAATDPDNGQSLSYSITAGNTNTAFTINPQSGVLSVAGSICFEACPLYTLTIRVTDNGSPVLYDDENVVIHLTDINENPVITNQNFNVNSYSSNGTVVGTVVATDPDQNQMLSFSISGGNTGGAFAIGASSGQITVANSQAVNYLINPTFSLTVVATDNGSPVLSSSATVSITVNPVNTAPVIANQSFSISENTSSGTVVGTITASDTDPGQSLYFSLVSGNTNGAFQLSGNGILSIANAQAIDFETNPVFNLIVQVSDNGQPVLTSTATITVNLIDVNEPPVFYGNTQFSLNEHVPQGTFAATISATDPDAGQQITYSIAAGNTNNAFAIAATTGVITVYGTVCFENCSQYSLTLRATDNGTQALYSEEQCVIQLNDINETPLIENQAFNVMSGAANGSIVGTVQATDPDMNQQLSYEIVSGNTDGAFVLNTLTGELIVANSQALNPASNPLFSLQVSATDNGSPALSASAIVTITLNTSNSAPVIQAQTISMSENMPAGFLAGLVSATDPDPGQTLSFAIVSGNIDNAFSINDAGELIVANAAAIDFESNPTFSLLVMVSDNGSPVLWAQSSVTVNLTDANDAPVILPQSFTVKENNGNGKYVCRVIATDQDPGDFLYFYLIDGNTNNAFYMQSNTGRLFVNNSAALDFETTPVFYLTVRAIDNDNSTCDQLITVSLIDVNESPVVHNQSFNVNRFSPNGTVVGKVDATDPDFGQTLKYTIVNGNTSNIFSLDINTGVIRVANANALQNTSLSVFNLNVRVRDNGSPALSSNGIMTIHVSSKASGELLSIGETKETPAPVISVYPNPASGSSANIKVEGLEGTQNKLIVTDLSGRILIETELSSTGSPATIDLQQFSKGMYIVRAGNSRQSVTTKLIRQ